MDVKSVKNGIEGLPDAVLKTADVIDSGTATSPLLSDHIKIPCKFECTFVILLAHKDFVGRVCELADKLMTMSWPKVGLEDVEYKAESSPGFLAPGGIHYFLAISCWVLKQ